MAKRELILSFEGPEKLVRPDRCDVRPLLEVLLAFIRLLEKIGAYNAALDNDEPPFMVVMKELRHGSIEHVLDFVPRYPTGVLAAVQRIGIEAATAAPAFLERREAGPEPVRLRAKRLASALGRLPVGVTAHLRGRVNASLSALADEPVGPTVVAVESFRAKILRAGGLTPRVQLAVAGHERPQTFDAPEEIAKLAGATLYAEANATAQVERTSDDRILHATLTELRILETGDPVAAFDRWYERAGKPWSHVVDIEQGLGRGES